MSRLQWSSHLTNVLAVMSYISVVLKVVRMTWFFNNQMKSALYEDLGEIGFLNASAIVNLVIESYN